MRDEIDKELVSENDRLRQQVTDLRGALERVEKIYYGDEFSEVWEAALEMAHVAREALKPTDNT